MKYLYKVFHEKNSTEFNEIYRDRISFDSAVRFNLSIKPIDQPKEFELYYVPTTTMIGKVSEIHRTSSELNRIFDSLPPVAKEQFISESLVEELYNTNQLEGVRSTKKEIARSVRNIKLNKKGKKRFHSMVKSYFSLINGEVTLPTEPQDFRIIYDEIAKDEIEASELPDGKVFRKDVTYIMKKSGSGEVVHRGITPEDKIHAEVDKLLNFMNDETHEVPLVIRTAVGHYFFGYIHPFYDGNGRTSRFISSMYLSAALGHVSALSLSQGCNKFTKKYLESFEVSNSFRNRGEMNCFIESFLSIILDALKEMLAGLKEKDQLLKIAVEKIENDPDLGNVSSTAFMFVLAQNHFFRFSEGVTIKELSEVLDLSASTVRKVAKELLDLSLIEQEGIRPAIYTIKQEYFEN